MNHEAHQDDILFDRLVDGELVAEERQRLLASLGDRPDGWRKCALAFLEAQAWRSEMKEIVRDAHSARAAAPADAPLRASSGGRGFRRWALAASVLAAFTLGLAMRGDVLSLHRTAPNPAGFVAATAPGLPGGASLPPATEADDALTLWVRNERGQAQPLRVPLVDASALDRQLGLEFQPGLTEAVRDRLQQQGYHVHSKRRYAPLMLENGRPLVVPVEDTRIVPVSQVVY